ncbi:MAG: hypothetical protein V3V78_04980 [Candidatus Woesearchaeota archaeon]
MVAIDSNYQRAALLCNSISTAAGVKPEQIFEVFYSKKFHGTACTLAKKTEQKLDTVLEGIPLVLAPKPEEASNARNKGYAIPDYFVNFLSDFLKEVEAYSPPTPSDRS